MPSEQRKIRANGKELGEIPLRRLFTLRTRGELENPVEFYSDTKQSWLPIAGIMEDIEPSSRLRDMRETGIEYVSILDSGTGEDCRACKALCRKKYSIAEVPPIPPADCSCVPWCRCVIVPIP